MREVLFVSVIMSLMLLARLVLVYIFLLITLIGIMLLYIYTIMQSMN